MSFLSAFPHVTVIINISLCNSDPLDKKFCSCHVLPNLSLQRPCNRYQYSWCAFSMPPKLISFNSLFYIYIFLWCIIIEASPSTGTIKIQPVYMPVLGGRQIRVRHTVTLWDFLTLFSAVELPTLIFSQTYYAFTPVMRFSQIPIPSPNELLAPHTKSGCIYKF